jgi:hypothetical protein
VERLAALVPRPRLHLIRFHGVLAPNAKLRSQIVVAPPQRASESPTDAHAQRETPPRMSWAATAKTSLRHRRETLPNSGGALKIIAAIEDPPVIDKILGHLGLPTRGRPHAPRVELIYSKRSEEPKTACQTQAEGIARSEFAGIAPKQPFTHFPFAVRSSRPLQHSVLHQPQDPLTLLTVLRYSSGP